MCVCVLLLGACTCSPASRGQNESKRRSQWAWQEREVGGGSEEGPGRERRELNSREAREEPRGQDSGGRTENASVTCHTLLRTDIQLSGIKMYTSQCY